MREYVILKKIFRIFECHLEKSATIYCVIFENKEVLDISYLHKFKFEI